MKNNKQEEKDEKNRLALLQAIKDLAENQIILSNNRNDEITREIKLIEDDIMNGPLAIKLDLKKLMKQMFTGRVVVKRLDPKVLLLKKRKRSATNELRRKKKNAVESQTN